MQSRKSDSSPPISSESAIPDMSMSSKEAAFSSDGGADFCSSSKALQADFSSAGAYFCSTSEGLQAESNSFSAASRSASRRAPAPTCFSTSATIALCMPALRLSMDIPPVMAILAKPTVSSRSQSTNSSYWIRPSLFTSILANAESISLSVNVFPAGLIAFNTLRSSTLEMVPSPFASYRRNTVLMLSAAISTPHRQLLHAAPFL
mmetsp:Transcript_122598/g.216056  ORF Transcript_122598/g.216056 Transcript_122598/m.216056 type:complete len:205 (-) Transcript_122598:7-621(-)